MLMTGGWFLIISWLVVYQPLWKVWVRQLGWWNSQLKSTEWNNEIHVPNHQPVSRPYPLKGMETKPRHGCHALISRSRAISWAKETPWMERPHVARKKGGRNLTMTVPYANICLIFGRTGQHWSLPNSINLAHPFPSKKPPPLPTTSWTPPFFNWHSQVSSSLPRCWICFNIMLVSFPKVICGCTRVGCSRGGSTVTSVPPMRGGPSVATHIDQWCFGQHLCYAPNSVGIVGNLIFLVTLTVLVTFHYVEMIKFPTLFT